MQEPSAHPETPLSGGNSDSRVSRRGDVVLRRGRPQSATVQRYLAHLATCGFDRAPQPLGFEPDGRERVSYVPGLVSHAPEHWADVGRLREGGRMLRRMHEASLSFPRSDKDVWAISTAPDEVICHNDFAPYNLVLGDEHVAGVIDFDLVGPGPALRDLGYFAYWTVPMSFAADDLVDLTHVDIAQDHLRLRAIAEAYGTDDFGQLLECALEMLNHLADRDTAERLFGTEARASLERDGHFDHWQREAEAFCTNWLTAYRALLK